MKIGKDLEIVGNKSKMKMREHTKVMAKGKVQMITMGQWILQMMLHTIRNSSSLQLEPCNNQSTQKCKFLQLCVSVIVYIIMYIVGYNCTFQLVICFSIFSCSTVGQHPKKDIALNGNKTDTGIKKICIPAFIWRPTGGGLLNMAKPAQNLYFFDDFFKIFKKSVT